MEIRNNREKSFSLLEAVAVIGIMMILVGIAIVKSFGSAQTYAANSAMDTVVAQLRVARQLAITQRTNVQVFFFPAGLHNRFNTWF